MNTVFQLSIESECLIFRVKELDDMLHIGTLLFIILYILQFKYMNFIYLPFQYFLHCSKYGSCY